MTNKAQTEIIGLVIIVVLAAMGMLIAVKFTAEAPKDYEKQLAQAELPSDMIGVLLKTSSRGCNGLSMAETLQNCAGQNIACENGQNSCDYFIEVAQQIFGKTLEKWGIDYEFSAFNDEGSQLFALGKTCQGDKKSSIFPMPADSGELFVRIDICK